MELNLIDCQPLRPDAKCKAIQDQLRPFNYDLEAWQLAHPELMVKVWKEKYQDKEALIAQLETKIQQTQQELQTTKDQEADKTKKIARLEEKLKLLQETQNKLEKEQKEHNQTKSNFQYQLKECLTILFPNPNRPNLNNLTWTDLKEQIQGSKEKAQEQQEKITNLTNNLNNAILYGEHRDLEIKELNKLLTEKELENTSFKEKVREKLTKIKNTHNKIVESLES